MISGIQAYSLNFSNIYSPAFGKGKLSSEHLQVIEQLTRLGIVPTYDYHKDLDKLYEALETAATASSEKKEQEESELIDIAPQQPAFSIELDQSALVNKFLLGL
ncbi:hypothetical protein tpqmel_0565 [Candidatus Gastranaerophilus sp. (ex Termes propinquus)]|nr:hypothetical protein tpqmel_0565 [Candidatus Gastranaerophilus sp. (ex Termes propinquus)]